MAPIAQSTIARAGMAPAVRATSWPPAKSASVGMLLIHAVAWYAVVVVALNLTVLMLSH